VAEAQRRDLTDRLTLATRADGIGIWDIDLRSRHVAWSSEVFALYGVVEGSVTPSFELWADLLHPDDRERVLERARRFYASGGPYTDEFRIVRDNGSVRHVAAEAIAMLGDDGRPYRVVGTNRDVTVEREAAAERERLLQRLQLATMAGNIGVWELDVASGREMWDDSLCRMLGVGPGPQMRTMDEFLALVHAEDRERTASEMKAALQGTGRQGGPRAVRVVRSGGDVRDLMVSLYIERARDGSPLRVVGTDVDVTELRRTEREAHRAAARLEIATASSGIGVFERDAGGRLVYGDPYISALFELPPGTPLPGFDDAIERVLPEDRQRYAEARERCRHSDLPVRCEYRMQLNDGRVRDVLSWRRRLLDERGRYAGEVGALLDVSELRSAERRATELAVRLSFAQGAAGMGVWDWDIAGSGEAVWDAQMYRLYDETPGVNTLETFRARLHPDDAPRIDEATQRSLRDGVGFDQEFRIVTRNGVERVLASRGEVLRDARGVPARMVGVNWDVTARRRAEQLAREAIDRLRLATSAAGIGTWEQRIDGSELRWDTQSYALFGQTPDAGSPAQILRRQVAPEDLPAIDRALQAAIGGSGPYAAEVRILGLEGATRWLALRGDVQRDAAGRATHVFGVVFDISKARLAEAALRAKENAERANRAKSEFLSRMSHELRTPLNAIIGFTQLLELDNSDPPTSTQRERIGLIRNSGWHLLNLINDVLDLSRIESGRASVQMAVVPWAPLLEETLGMVQPEAAARGIVLEMRSEPEVPATLWADRTRLRQVLLNLLSNAVKYNRDHGTVSVSAGADRGEVVLAVRDTGRGLTADQVERLFQPFDRLGMEASGLAGTGIGLTIAQRLTQQMDGVLNVDSTPGVGSEFTLRLRAAQVQPLRPSLPPPPAASVGIDDSVRGTVLYIEDNPANSALVEQFLHFRPRVRLFQAADGATGLVMAGVSQPDLVLIDIRLPDMMGDEVLAQLRAQPETARITAVAVSANAMPHDVEQAMAAGFADYWTKPLEVTRFLQGIDRLLRAGRGAPAAAATANTTDGRA
jgi:PAS domain S-box-containing protein